MPKLATTHSLSNYPKLLISEYCEQIKKSASQHSVMMSYQHQGRHYSYQVEVTTTPCNYGGNRYWWHCPKCSKRVAVLYCAGKYVCRHCIGANYQSQLIQPIDRLFERVSVIRAKLGWQQGIAHGHGSRPRYMHHSTYDRLVSEHDQLTAKIIGALS